MQFPLKNMFTALFWPFGQIYKFGMNLRQVYYQKNVHVYVPEKPCVSVGNICMGGSGKTPVTAFITQKLVQAGQTPVILTRGYKAKPPHKPYFVATDSPVEAAGDEPLTLLRRCPEVPVVVDHIRARAARAAAGKLNPDIYILDDGFQHMAIARDMNIVLLRPEDLTTYWDRVFPCGPWREGKNALHRADCLLIRADNATRVILTPFIEKHLTPLGKPIFFFTLTPIGICHVDKQTKHFFGADYILVSGVGDNVQVADSAFSFTGQKPKKHFQFTDHYNYPQKTCIHIMDYAKKKGIQHILTTEKDAIKIKGEMRDMLWVLQYRVTFDTTDKNNFEKWFDMKMNFSK